MPEEYEFIEVYDDELYLEIQGRDQYLSLDALISEYVEGEMTPMELAETFHVTVEDVENGIMYWREHGEILDNPTVSSESVQTQESGALDPMDIVGNAFLDLMSKKGFEDTYIENSPEENYFDRSSEEKHLVWETGENTITIYAGLSEEENRGLVSFSVEDREGEILIIEEKDMGDWIREMYDNAVLETKNLS